MNEELSAEDVIHDLPATSSDERMHDLSTDCWCEPTTRLVGDELWVEHR